MTGTDNHRAARSGNRPGGTSAKTPAGPALSNHHQGSQEAPSMTHHTHPATPDRQTSPELATHQALAAALGTVQALYDYADRRLADEYADRQYALEQVMSGLADLATDLTTGMTTSVSSGGTARTGLVVL